MKQLLYILIITTSLIMSGCIFVGEYSSCNDSTLWDDYETDFYDYEVYDGCFIKSDHTEIISEYYCMYDYIYRRDRLALYDKNWHERIEFENKGDSYPVRSCYMCQCNTQY